MWLSSISWGEELGKVACWEEPGFNRMVTLMVHLMLSFLAKNEERFDGSICWWDEVRRREGTREEREGEVRQVLVRLCVDFGRMLLPKRPVYGATHTLRNALHVNIAVARERVGLRFKCETINGRSFSNVGCHSLFSLHYISLAPRTDSVVQRWIRAVLLLLLTTATTTTATTTTTSRGKRYSLQMQIHDRTFQYLLPIGFIKSSCGNRKMNRRRLSDDMAETVNQWVVGRQHTLFSAF